LPIVPKPEPKPAQKADPRRPEHSHVQTQPDGPVVVSAVLRSPALAELLAFHGEIRVALDRLTALVRATQRGHADSAVATGLVRFFEGPLLWHDEDEEVSLIRRLRGASLSSAQLALVEATHRGHDKMENLLDELTLELRELVKGEQVVDVVALERNARALKSLLDGHLALEESSVFPLAAEVFDDLELEAIHREIIARHGRTTSGAVRNKRAIAL
jgi:hemerythrin-like domain-containing protein